TLRARAGDQCGRASPGHRRVAIARPVSEVGENGGMRSSLAVAAGALAGASMRWWIAEWLHTDGFPWATLLVNVVGCALIGWCAIALGRGTVAWYGVVTGGIGALTTMSAFAAETRALVADGRGVAAVLYVLASTIGGL